MQPRASVVRGTLSVITAAALVVSAGAASATVKKKKPAPPKPVCNIVKAGRDASVDQSLNITSADVATNATAITSVIRVTKLTASGPGQDPTAPTGREWDLTFTIDGHQVSLTVDDGPFNLETSYGGIGTATLDTAKNEVRYTTTLSALARATNFHVKNGSSVLTNFIASTKTTVESPNAGPFPGGHLAVLQAADTAQSPVKYLAGYPSCVKVGS